MTLHQQASTFSTPVVRTRESTRTDSSFALVVLWAALGIVLAMVLLRLDPTALSALQTLS